MEKYGERIAIVSAILMAVIMAIALALSMLETKKQDKPFHPVQTEKKKDKDDDDVMDAYKMYRFIQNPADPLSW